MNAGGREVVQELCPFSFALVLGEEKQEARKVV
jgi:hypothetical protein